MCCLRLQEAKAGVSEITRRGAAQAPLPTVMETNADTHIDQLLAQRRQFLAFVRRRVSDAALAEDILQAAYLRAYEHQDEFSPGESAVAWFYRLLRNAVIDNYRRNSARSKALETWTREIESSVNPSEDEQVEVCACLHGIIEGLKPEYAEIL